MLIRIRRGWELPEAAAMPEALVMHRRALLAGAGAMLAAPVALPARAAGIADAVRNDRFPPGRAITPEGDATSYNNFYEFGTDKGIASVARRMPLSPWTVKIDGMVETPREFAIDELLRDMPLEERVYRLRCVEAWAMTVPWTGFPLSALLAKVNPLGSARYVVFETAAKRDVMPGLRQSWYPWPYIEACTVAEAANELSFMVVGAYGKALPASNGGPLRLHQPWKYGFKAGKSLVRITLTDQRPRTFWEALQPQEYGFWANVNPQVPHPRWSQAHERLLSTGERVPTQMWNGYGEFVAGMYSGLQNERLFM